MKRKATTASRAHYQKLVYWSDEDGCFVGKCPALFLSGVHGSDEAKVYADLCQAVEEHLALMERDGVTAPSDSQEFSGRLTIRIDPGLHRALALRAKATRASLNSVIEQTLARGLS